MTWRRSCTVDQPPEDPVGDAVAAALAEVMVGSSVELLYSPRGKPPMVASSEVGTALATSDGPPGWDLTIVVRLVERVARLLQPGTRTTLAELLDALPGAGVRAADRLRHHLGVVGALPPPLRRALRDDVATEILAAFLSSRVDAPTGRDLIAETIEYLIELSGTRVEAHHLTHGVIIADVLRDAPRLQFRYPADIRAAKRAPLLFDGQRAVLVVDPLGRARTELERHRFDHLVPDREDRVTTDWFVESGSLVADATRALGGLGFFVRADRSIWTFVDGQPLLVRRGEHWTAFPLELTASISNMIDGGPVAAVVARTAFLISTQPSGAILAIVSDPSSLDGVVPVKDRYDLRREIGDDEMRPETRLHHLIDPYPLDEHTLARLATLDGATVVDRNGQLLAYGAIVTSADSEHEGARTAAAKTLSEIADVVLKVSVDGDITIFRDGAVVTTLLGHPAHDDSTL